MERNMSTKDTIKKARYKLQMTQTEFAKMLGIHKSSMSLYENGNRIPSFPTIRHIVAVLKKKGISVKFEDFIDE
jgi:transcriptional regulator with XRE-family HTH domain